MPRHPITPAESQALDQFLDLAIPQVIATQGGCVDFFRLRHLVDQHVRTSYQQIRMNHDALRAWLALNGDDMPLLFMASAERTVTHGRLCRCDKVHPGCRHAWRESVRALYKPKWMHAYYVPASAQAIPPWLQKHPSAPTSTTTTGRTAS